jgi:hypothetical protein
MATKTKRSGDQKTRKPGKGTSGWEKVGVYLSPDAALRLQLAAMKRGKDRSTILNQLVLGQLPAYTISVGSNDRPDPGVDVNPPALAQAS